MNNIILIVGALGFIIMTLYACCRISAIADERAQHIYEKWQNKMKGEVPSNAEADDPASPIA